MRGEEAFSLLETLIAVAITTCLGALAFQLFHQNERLFRDQSLILEMQQSARVVLSQVTDDVRMAGQALPRSLTDIILPGSGSSRINLRTGFSAVESPVTTTLPIAIVPGSSLTVVVESTSGFSSGRQAFIWTERDFARGTINTVSGSARSVRITPTAASRTPLEFATPPTLSVDEAVAVYWDSVTKSIRRTTTTNTENAVNPSWAPANELAANVSELTFLYFNREGASIVPDTAERRSEVALIEVRVGVYSSSALSDGSRPTYSLSRRAVPRSLEHR